VPIQYLLLYDVQNKHNQNKILGDKVVQVVRQNIQLAQQAPSAYKNPSEKLKKDPIMGLVTKTVAIYMFLRHNNGQRRTTTRRRRTFRHGGSHFSKRRSESKNNRSEEDLKGESQKKRYKGLMKRGTKQKETKNKKKKKLNQD
jgi:hypothetical protein